MKGKRAIARMLLSRGKPDECWPYQEARTHTRGGYGIIRVDGKTCRAHRVMYELLVGKIPDGLHLDHLCGNTACINPAHLEPVTCKENLRRSKKTWASINAAKTECPKGHPYTPENSQLDKNGHRCCKECGRIRSREYQRAFFAKHGYWRGRGPKPEPS